jgi:FkbM family methyltransferase
MESFSLTDSKKVPLDFKLNEIINKENGFFIELGAYNGIDQSNTAFFEFYKSWTGILIEPSYDEYIKCVDNRKNSVVLNCACVSNDYKDEFIQGDFNNGPMSSINGSRVNGAKITRIKARTLENILDEHSNNKIIDLLSLDVEGYELNVLKGLNLKKYRPTYLLIEIYNNQYSDICNFLSENNYKLHSNFTNYNNIDNPIWDGSHNDYLFISNE